MSLSITASNALTFDVRGAIALAGAEISAFDPGSNRLYVTSGSGLQVVDLSDPTAPALIGTIDLRSLGYATTDVTSVAIHGGIVAVALPASPKSDPGTVVFLDAATGAKLGDATVGSLPDMVTFTPDGTRLLVANEGEYLDNNGGPGTAEGSVSIIDLSGGFGAALPVVTAGFGAFDADALRAQGVRIALGQTAALDLEPEYIAVSPDGTKAMVTLQEANAVGLLDIASGVFTDVVALGTKDFSTLLADFSDRDGPGGTAMVNLQTGHPVFGLYMPDGIHSYSVGGETYYVIANEGDDRNDFLAPDEVIRLGSSAYDLDDATFPDEAQLKTDAELGRLNVVNTPGLNGDLDGDGDIDQILTLGGRSFSILDSTGRMVFDSGDIIERIAATLVSTAVFDDRSDNKGPEPESIEIAVIDGRTYAFVGLERTNATLAFDITDPAEVTYTGVAQRPGDVAPEGGLYIAAEDSPTGEALYVTSNEGSNTVSVFAVNPTYTLQILHASDFEAGVQATERAKNFAAIVDVLEDQYANSITLSSGDNFIPGPFTAAGTDPSVRDEIASFYEQRLGLPDGSLSGIRNGTLPFNAADIAILNAIGIQASVLGNHEFDLGTAALASAFDTTGSLPALPNGATLANITNIGALFPYLSANLDVSGDSALASLYTSALREAASYATTAAELATDTGIRAEVAGQEIAPWTTITEGGETIGVLGVTTQLLASLTSLGGVTVADPAGDGGIDNMDELAAILQPLVDQMAAQGISKIILLSHLQQIDNERLLATKLSGVDVIIGGGSHTIFADATDSLDTGDSAGGTYPELYTGADGALVALVNTGSNYDYVGRLVVTFDSDGHIIPGSIDETVSGAYVTTDAGVDAVAGDGDGVLSEAERDVIFADGTRGGEVEQITDAIAAVIQEKDGNVFGYTDVFLEGRRTAVRAEETNLGDLSADANLAFAKSHDLDTLISIKNGGGIRAEIGTLVPATGEGLPPQENPVSGKEEGGVSQLDIENSLRFNNQLSLITLTAQGLLNALENALRSAGPDATPGAFPQISGLTFSWDPDRAALDRVVDLAIVNQHGVVVDVIAESGAIVGDATREFRLVTLNFLAPGSDTQTSFGDNIFVRGIGEITETSAGVVSGTLAVYNSFEALDRVDLTGTGTGFDQIGGEQRALADYLSALHGTQETAFDQADTDAAADERIQNLNERTGTVLEQAPVRNAAEDDVVVGTSLDNAVDGGRGADQLYGLGGNDRLRGNSQADLVSGGDGDDTLSGGLGNDTVLGGDGDDRLRGKGGDDVLTGGAGADEFIFAANQGRDVVTDFTVGVDHIVLRPFGFADVAAVLAQATDTGSGVEIDLAGTTILLSGVTRAELSASDFIL